uniref:Retroviral polymerase SH3-like domain-containing protein n=1 Tax=Chenopodium quinoa TaxID=63459 RepID=A0A803LV75_CHEQI
NIKISLPATESASKFLKNVEECFKSADKSLAGTSMAELTTMKYDGQKGVQQHILNMSKKAAKLKELGIGIDESFLVHFILNSLPSQFEPFKIHYNANSEKWNLNELSSKCVQEEVRLGKKENVLLLMYLKNLVSLSRLDYAGYNIVIGSRRMDLLLNTVMVGSAILYDAEARIYNPHEKKLDSRTVSGYFIGYPDKSKGYRFYCPNHSTRIVETGNARLIENSVSNELRKVEIEEIRVDIPPPFLPTEIVAPQPSFHVEDHEQHDGDSSLLPENVAIENDVEPPQPAALRRSQRERKSVISDDYVVYLQESDFDIGIRKDPVSSQALEVVGYSDSDSMKSTLGFVFMLANGAISWQRLGVVDSIAKPLKIFCDNTTAVFFSKNGKF